MKHYTTANSRIDHTFLGISALFDGPNSFASSPRSYLNDGTGRNSPARTVFWAKTNSPIQDNSQSEALLFASGRNAG